MSNVKSMMVCCLHCIFLKMCSILHSPTYNLAGIFSYCACRELNPDLLLTSDPLGGYGNNGTKYGDGFVFSGSLEGRYAAIASHTHFCVEGVEPPRRAIG